MKNLNFNTQICTTKEQSKRLLELGLDADTSDMCWLAKKLWGDDVEIPEDDRRYILSTDKDDSFCNRYDVDCVPAWSLHRLIVLLPAVINTRILSMPMNYPDTRIVDFEHNSIGYLNMFGFGKMFNKSEGKYALYNNIIDCIESLIQDGFFNKEYLLKEE